MRGTILVLIVAAVVAPTAVSAILPVLGQQPGPTTLTTSGGLQ